MLLLAIDTNPNLWYIFEFSIFKLILNLVAEFKFKNSKVKI